MQIKLRKKSVQFIDQEQRDANSNINCSVRAPGMEENVVTIGIPLFAFVERALQCAFSRDPAGAV